MFVLDSDLHPQFFSVDPDQPSRAARDVSETLSEEVALDRTQEKGKSIQSAKAAAKNGMQLACGERSVGLRAGKRQGESMALARRIILEVVSVQV